jgi:hypothetical protein
MAVKLETCESLNSNHNTLTPGAPESLTSPRVPARYRRGARPPAARRRRRPAAAAAPQASFPCRVLSSALTRAGTIQRSDALLGHRI